ncbi:MAG: RidA family protein [Pseudohongiella sp.]|nr:RidA family protein [Pseudohongiella sp.]
MLVKQFKPLALAALILTGASSQANAAADAAANLAVNADDASAICAAMDLAALEPAPGMMYASARISNGLVFVSGQIGVDTASSAPAPDFEAQMLEALSRLERVLAQAGSSVALIQRATVYVTDPANLATMNRLYRAFFERHAAPLPARSLVPGLNFGNAIAFEIDVIASQVACD